ncbi:MAG: hypothetical protein GY809_20020 [Planctomycetes bacterium]|nr:hypothetical protein [Planctomycetota bacterium]
MNDAYRTKTTVAVLLFVASLCSAQYDLYCMGSSYTIDDRYIQSMVDASGLDLKAGRSNIYGNMSTVQQRATGRPLDRGNPLHDLASGTVDVLAMTATRPWRYTSAEAKACTFFGRQLLKHSPNARLFIHDYWTVSPPDRSLYPELHGWDNVRGMNLGAIKIIHLMARALNHRVYIIPIGTAVQVMREKILAGKLEAYKHPRDLMSDSIHLSEMGRYIQACLTFCGACRYDVRQLPRHVVDSRGQTRLTFTASDARVIHQVVYDTVRNTPYSGWYRHEPNGLEAYLAHLRRGLNNWESFDRLQPTSDTGRFIGDTGIAWHYRHISVGNDGEILTDAFLKMQKSSSLRGTIPGGITDLHFAMYRGAKIEVLVDGQSMGLFKPVRDGGWNNHYFKIKDLNRTGDVDLAFICQSPEAILDNISWTAPQ